MSTIYNKSQLLAAIGCIGYPCELSPTLTEPLLNELAAFCDRHDMSLAASKELGEILEQSCTENRMTAEEFMASTYETPGEAYLKSRKGECECHRCIEENNLTISHPALGKVPLSVGKMILCPECGNKRCPQASDHRLECTNSNDEGQVKMEVFKAYKHVDDPFGRPNPVAVVYRGDDGRRRTSVYMANHSDAADDLIKLLEREMG